MVEKNHVIEVVSIMLAGRLLGNLPKEYQHLLTHAKCEVKPNNNKKFDFDEKMVCYIQIDKPMDKKQLERILDMVKSKSIIAPQKAIVEGREKPVIKVYFSLQGGLKKQIVNELKPYMRFLEEYF